MDKLKTILAAIKKYHFWVVCALVILIGLGVWASATADLAKRFAQRRDTLESDFNKAGEIAGRADHPNERVIAELHKQHAGLKGDVLGAWTFLYKQQKEMNPWPEKLGQDFLQEINSLEPDQEIPRTYREVYQNFIKGHLPRLFEIVGARVPKEDLDASQREGFRTSGAARAAGGRDGRKAEVRVFGNKVDWESGDWQKLIERFNWPTTPTTLQVRFAQEDLWVYEALLRILDQTNAGVTGHFNAAVKRIEALEVGKDAATALQRGKAKPAEGGFGGPGGPGGPGFGGPGPGPGMGPGMPGGGFSDGAVDGGSAEQELALTLKQDRYVDENGIPLAAGAQEPFAEFKMMPICMRLVMDQRKIPELLLQCANSSMPVEVQEVHIGSAVGAVGGSRQSGGGGLGGAGGFAGNKRSSSGDESGPYDIPVEIVGIIYIYNPPDLAKLGTGAAGEKSETGPSAAPAPGAAEGGPAAPESPPGGPR